jgi:large subunit ribosomal protein L19
MTKVKTKEKKLIKPTEIQPGMLVKIHQKIKELNPKGELKERIQAFEGLVLARRGSGLSETVTVHKDSYGVGVEKIFPLRLPSITKIELVKKFKTRRAKLYFLRDNPKRLKEEKIS